MLRSVRVHVAARAVRCLVLLVTGLTVAPLSAAPLAQAGANTAAAPRASSLRIVVLEGEDAVNIVQQRTAVAPVVEVRDRNDQPVAGAVVRFAVRTGKATFRGARTISVTTNAAGRAAAEGLVPTGTGPLQIAATASYQGQAAAVTIVQSNVATAAQAASAAGGAGAGAGSGAGASAGGAAGTASGSGAAAGTAAGAAAGAAGGVTAAAGASAGAAAAGISTTTLVVAGGAAVAGSAVVATKVAGGDDSGSGSGGSTVSGAFSGQSLISPPPTAPANCAYTTSNEGTLTLQYTESNGALSGQATIKARWAVANVPCGGLAIGPFFDGTLGPTPLSGSAANISFTVRESGVSGNVNVTHTYSFSGSLANGVVTGTLNYTYRGVLPNGSSENGSAQMPVTLR